MYKNYGGETSVRTDRWPTKSSQKCTRSSTAIKQIVLTELPKQTDFAERVTRHQFPPTNILLTVNPCQFACHFSKVCRKGMWDETRAYLAQIEKHGSARRSRLPLETFHCFILSTKVNWSLFTVFPPLCSALNDKLKLVFLLAFFAHLDMPTVFSKFIMAGNGGSTAGNRASSRWPRTPQASHWMLNAWADRTDSGS